MALPNNFVKIRISRGMCVDRKETGKRIGFIIFLIGIHNLAFLAIEKKNREI